MNEHKVRNISSKRSRINKRNNDMNECVCLIEDMYGYNAKVEKNNGRTD